MSITQTAGDAAAAIACGAHRERILSGDWDDDATVQAIAAAEARGFARAKEMAEGLLRNYYEDGLADEIAAMKDDQS